MRIFIPVLFALFALGLLQTVRADGGGPYVAPSVPKTIPPIILLLGPTWTALNPFQNLTSPRVFMRAVASRMWAYFTGGDGGGSGCLRCSTEMDVFRRGKDGGGIERITSRPLPLHQAGVSLIRVGTKLVAAGGYNETGAGITAHWRSDFNSSGSTISFPKQAYGMQGVSVSSAIGVFAGGFIGPKANHFVFLFYASNNSFLTSQYAPETEARYDITVGGVGNLVLLAGGTADGSPETGNDTVFILDVTTRRWSASRLSVPRSQIATATYNNEAYFAGGQTTTIGVYSTAVDIYSGSTHTWRTFDLRVARSGIAVVASHGQVFFAGGWNSTQFFSLVEVYDVDLGALADETKTPTAGFVPARMGGVGATIDDAVLFIGGVSESGDSSAVNVFNLTTRGWQEPLSLEYAGPGKSCVSSNTTVICAGGAIVSNWASNAVDAYDTKARTWTAPLQMQVARYNHAAVSVGNLLLLAGGTGVAKSALSSVEILDMQSRRWIYSDLPSGPRTEHCGLAVGELAFFAGGRFGSTLLNTIDFYNVSSRSWGTHYDFIDGNTTLCASKGEMAFFAVQRVSATYWTFVVYNATANNFTHSDVPAQFYYAEMAVCQDYVFVVGTEAPTLANGNLNMTAKVVAFKIDTQEWLSVPAPSLRIGTSLAVTSDTLLVSGRVLRTHVTGSLTYIVNRTVITDEVDVFNVTSWSWQEPLKLKQPRFELSAVTAANVALFGGGHPSGTTVSAVVDEFGTYVEPPTCLNEKYGIDCSCNEPQPAPTLTCLKGVWLTDIPTYENADTINIGRDVVIFKGNFSNRGSLTFGFDNVTGGSLTIAGSADLSGSVSVTFLQRPRHGDVLELVRSADLNSSVSRVRAYTSYPDSCEGEISLDARASDRSRLSVFVAVNSCEPGAVTGTNGSKTKLVAIVVGVVVGVALLVAILLAIQYWRIRTNRSQWGEKFVTSSHWGRQERAVAGL